METKNIEIPSRICEEIQHLIEDGNEFSSVEEYITVVLEEVLKDDEDASEDYSFTEIDEEKVKERLRGLGYL